MKSINKLTKKLETWFSKDSNKSESPLLLQSLEDRVLYSAVPLPVENVDAPVEQTDLDDVQFIEIESNTNLPIGEAIAQEMSSQFLAQDNFRDRYAATSAEATLEDLDQLVNSFQQNDTTALDTIPSTEEGFLALDEDQSFLIDSNSAGNSNRVSPGVASLGFPADGTGELQRVDSHNQFVVSSGPVAGDSNELDGAFHLNGESSGSITDTDAAQHADGAQEENTINLRSSGSSLSIGASTAASFGEELELFRFENSALEADDQNGGVTQRQANVGVPNANQAPVIIANDSVFVDEGNTFVQTVSVTDADGDPVTLSIFDDGEPPVFTIDRSGNITFISTPDFEVPFDSSGNNIDLVTVLADDGNGGISNQTITVTLNDVDEAPVFVGTNQQLLLQQAESSTSTFNLVNLFNDPENQNLVLEIAGGANANLFHIVNNELALIAVPEIIGAQSPTYEVQILASDGVNESIVKTVNLQVNNINDAPESSVSVISASQDELVATSFGVEAQYRSDADGDATSLIITGDGADNSLFQIVNDRIEFIVPPTWENGGQNFYVVTTALFDGTENSELIRFEITVDNVNDRPEITDFTPVLDSLDDFQLSQVVPGTIVADLNQATTFDRDGDSVNFQIDSTGTDNNLFFIDGSNRLRFSTTPQLVGIEQQDFTISVIATDGQLSSTPEVISVTVQRDTNVNVVDPVTVAAPDNQPQNQEPIANNSTPPTNSNTPNSDSPEGNNSRPAVASIPESLPIGESTPQPISQRRNDINGITAISDLKISDEDVFFDLTSDSVSYVFQFGAPGPQLVTQEIGDINKARHAVEDLSMEESMLANYFWQGFEDSEEEFIRKNLEVDNTTLVAASAGLSLGVVSYLRLAAMATTAVTQLPAWKTLDVAPLISAFDEEETETIHQIVDQ